MKFNHKKIRIEYLKQNDLMSFLKQADLKDKLDLFQHPSWLNAIEEGL